MQEGSMKRLMTAGLMAAALAWSAPALTAQAPGAKADAKGEQVTVSGCLAQGKEPGSYMLNNARPAAAKDAAAKSDTAMDKAQAKTYHVTAEESLKLAGHVGHIVELTGQVDSQAMGATSGATGTTGGKSGSSTVQLKATAMKHVAAKCN
jgi:hypothetical protein